MISHSAKNKKQRKLRIFEKASQLSRLKLENLFGRVQDLSSTENAFLICEIILNEDSIIQLYYYMSDEELLQELSVIISLQPNPELQGARQIQCKQSQNNFISSIHMDQTRKKKPISQIKKTQKEDQKYPQYMGQIIKYISKYRKFLKNLDQKKLQYFFQLFQQYYKLPILQKHQIQIQANKYRNKNDKQSFLRQLLITDSALYYTTDRHRLRITQALAIYCFIYHPQIKRCLLQILTGQGKSTTIACLASILNMRSMTVDIITTNKILAKRDAEEKSAFYKLMGIQVKHNISSQNNNKQLEAPRSCYQKGTIVYGTPFSYQVDLLYDQYKKKGTRNSRPYYIAIVDQVDSMFVDQKQTQTLLASIYSGFSELREPLKMIWQTIVTHNIVRQDGKYFILEYGQKQGDIIKGEASKKIQLIINDLRETFKNQVVNLEKAQFIQMSINDWVQSAILAAHIYKENIHYIIDNGKIVPVDFKNTGCLQKNVEWENGLHQFLQIKHDLDVSIESMTSNYMSNVGFFSRYDSVYGLTGTLGSQKSMQFLKNTYNVEMMQIPPFRIRKLQINPGYLMYDNTGWVNKIVERCQFMMNSKRSVLIICQNIQYVKEISYILHKKVQGMRNLRRMQTGQQESQDLVGVGDIIIATNVAGRGTDLKATEDLIKNGGLHVIVSFMPSNLRVQMQARGRAGRNGAPGSSQLIINFSEYCKNMNIPLILKQIYLLQGFQNKIKYIQEQIRDQYEARLMEQDEERVNNLRAKDKMFEIFCKATNKVHDYQTNSAKRNAIQQQWAMFLKRCQLNKLSNEQKIHGAQQFGQQIQKNSQSFYKKSHGVLRGLNQLNKNNLGKAKQLFRTVQGNDCTKNLQIAGSILEGAVQIQQDGKNSQKIKKGFQKMVGQSIKLIQQRKDIVKGLNFRNLTTENSQITQFLRNRRQQQQNRMRQQFSGQYQNERNINHQQNRKIQNIKENNQMQKITNNGHIKALDALKSHLLKQAKKVQNLASDQYLDVSYKPLMSLMDETQGKEQNMKERLEQLSTDIPIIPIVQKKKKKTKWWKRLLVFVLGVLQICIGALIVAATSGAAAGFGAFMIQSGFKDCMNALFKPELLDDLSKYFTQKAIEYGMAATLAGTSALKQIYSKGLEGFSLIRNSSMSQVMNLTMSKIGQGLSKGGFDISGILQQNIFEGLSNRLTNLNKHKLEPNQITKIVKRQDFQDTYNKSFDQQAKLQFKGKQIQQKFEQQASKIIINIIRRQYPKFIPKISQLKIPKNHVIYLIQNSLKGAFDQKLNYQKRDKLYFQMCHILTKNIQNKQSLAQVIIREFQIDKLITQTIKSIPNNQDFNKVIKSANNVMQNQIRQNLNNILEKYKKKNDQSLNRLNSQRSRIQNTALVSSQRNRQVEIFNQQAKQFERNQQILNKFIEQINPLLENDIIVQKLIQMRIISNGLIIKNSTSLNTLHPYFKEALMDTKNFQTGQNNFMMEMQTVACNSFFGIFSKALTAVLDRSSNSVSKLKQLEKILYKQLYKS